MNVLEDGTMGTLRRETHGHEPVIIQPIALAENTIGRQPQNGGNGDGFTVDDPMYTLNAMGVHGVAQSVSACDAADTLTVGANQTTGFIGDVAAQSINQTMAVRRLTPIECERLQGFPDNYTNIPWRKKEQSPDGPRYKALGNSMAVPVMHWIGKRIQMVEDL